MTGYTEFIFPLLVGSASLGEMALADMSILATTATLIGVEKLLPNSSNNIIEPGKFIISTTVSSCPLIQNLNVGDVVTLNFSMYAKEPLDNTVYATGGGPMLVQQGNVNITSKAENFKSDITKGTAPRTAVGVNYNNTELIIVTVDGRSADSKGMTLNTLAEFMKELGCYNAMNLDGGGSTTMSILGLVMNSPSEKAQRNVANALLVFSDYKSEKISPAKDYNGLIARGESCYKLEDLGNVVWGTNGKIGYFDSHNETKGKIGYIYNGNLYDFNVEISNASINDILVEKIQSDICENGIKYHCIVKLIDKNNNLMPLSPIFVYVNNGKTDRLKYISDERGEINFDVLFYNKNNIVTENEETVSFEGETDENTEEEFVKSIRFVFGDFVKVIEF